MQLSRALDQIQFTRKGSYVKRWHAKTIIGEQNLGHHSFNVVSLILLLHPAPPPALLRAALWHDMAEQDIGDVPSPALRASPEYGRAYKALEEEILAGELDLASDDLLEVDQAWLWGADKLECYLFCREQVRLGNRSFEPSLRILQNWFEHTEQLPQQLSSIYRAVRDQPLDKEIDDPRI